MKKAIVTTTQAILGSDVFSIDFNTNTGIKTYKRANLKCVKALAEGSSVNKDILLNPVIIGTIYLPINMIASIIIKD